MGSEKRARQKENRQARLQAERRAALRAKWRQRVLTGLVIAVLAVAIFLIGNLLTDDDSADSPAPQQVVVTDVTTAGVPSDASTEGPGEQEVVTDDTTTEGSPDG